jgi:hypothetical protein
MEELNRALARAADLKSDPSKYTQNMKAAAKLMPRFTDPPDVDASGKVTLARFASAAERRWQMLEFMQNWADPRWRDVAHPSNSHRWTCKFSHTKYYAQGNSAVVVVRDSPVSFRVMRGTNNPATLIQQQLRIARAVGAASIEVAAGMSGIPIGSLDPPVSDENGETQAAPAASDPRLEREALTAERERFLSDMRRDVADLRRRIESLTGADAEERARQLIVTELIPMLAAYQSGVMVWQPETQENRGGD